MPRKPKTKPGTPERPVARVALLHAGVLYDPGEQLPTAQDEIPVINGRARPVNLAVLLARGQACDGSCDVCDCHAG
jgi:hypothetical protein